ncbi:MAG: di-heme-cytochrome C peroxidase [Methylophilaceae bacterium]
MQLNEPHKTSPLFALVLLISTTLINTAQAGQYLEQNWTSQDREYFYFADQGSRLVPYDYFLYLEQANQAKLFRSDENMLRFGAIPAQKSKNNPDGFPIGFTRNKDKMGLTCAACHTQQISYQNKITMIDGGQPLFDLQKMLTEMTLSLKATLDDADKFNRFQANVLGKQVTESAKVALKKSLQKEYEKRVTYANENHTDVHYGYGRLDAFGAILNRGLEATGLDKNANPANAPTSYPYLWDTPQHDYVEWNGAQANSNIGAFARNIGEVIGVFGDVTPQTQYWLGFIDGGYPSSIQASELRKLEKTVSKLHSPQWPAYFPKINIKLAQQGRKLYELHCMECHVDINRADPKRMIKVRMSTLDEIKTDPMMAKNAILNTGKSGKLEGQPRYYVAGDPLPKVAPAIDIANNVMVGVIKNNPLQAYLAGKDASSFGHGDEIHPPKYVDGKIIATGQEVSQKALLAYKARPLNGVWSSAPFLHNGSVPNLYQLLLPAKDRVKQFNLGSLEFDTKNVGFDMAPVKEYFLFDTTLPGNSNAGHEYGTGAGYNKLPMLTEQERWALIEYLKTI